MTTQLQQQWDPYVRVLEIVQQTKTALVSMDANRLEELAESCCDLKGRLEIVHSEAASSTQQLRMDIDLEKKMLLEMQTLQGILVETHANLSVLSRLRMEWWDKSNATLSQRARIFNPTAH